MFHFGERKRIFSQVMNYTYIMYTGIRCIRLIDISFDCYVNCTTEDAVGVLVTVSRCSVQYKHTSPTRIPDSADTMIPHTSPTAIPDTMIPSHNIYLQCCLTDHLQ